MSEDQITPPEFSSHTFISSAPTNDQDVYIKIVEQCMMEREGVVDYVLLSDIEELWDQYVQNKRKLL